MNPSNQHERSEFLESSGSRLKERRKLLRLTQEELAAAAGVSPKLVGMVEAGKPTVQLDGLEKILTVLGFSLALGERA
jgi:transcriptional regulator with XRE-family HTH domain